ncbi:ABC transporter ATP-binding protein [Gallaecimonas mangrovi]|uniref:ABC transporter ATP-binding protein n=1 Tax=Gallaecimonas mangrovi TaxID=2291597 RepID=UPI000E1FF7FA|nr:ABC transporter ATP-binding protein [Gallaecimonas mangrovi]
MDTLIKLRGLSKNYGQKPVLQDLDLDVKRGEILGLVGVNGAGKSTLLNAILGLDSAKGELEVLGQSPIAHRAKLLKRVAYIADVASLPRWMRCDQLIRYMQGVHPNFDAKRCQAILASTQIGAKARVSALSKGMVTQLHLALVMAIDADILVLDEPTLGLDLVYRRGFYQRLLEDYFDHQRTIIITTHQVEEIEHILTRVLFLHNGRFVLDSSVDALANHYCQVQVSAEQLASARALGPIAEKSTISGHLLTFEKSAAEVSALGQAVAPSIADIFVAKVGSAA